MTFIPLPQPSAPEEGEFDEAGAPDDDSLFQRKGLAGLSDAEREAVLVPQCEERLKRALVKSTPNSLIKEMRQHGCTAIKGEPCAKCRMCPAGSAWQEVAGYFNAQKHTVYICAEKEPTQGRIEQTLNHELLRAYDHCRFGARVPFVGVQAPWALTCAATACAEVRAYLLSSFSAAGLSGGLASSTDSGSIDDSFSAESNLSSEFVDPYSGGAQSSATSSALSDMSRALLYKSVLDSVDLHRACGREGKDARAVLDAVFNACTDDNAPFGPTPGVPRNGAAFPAMPPEVGQADASSSSVRLSPQTSPPASGGGSSEFGNFGDHNVKTEPKWGDV